MKLSVVWSMDGVGTKRTVPLRTWWWIKWHQSQYVWSFIRRHHGRQLVRHFEYHHKNMYDWNGQHLYYLRILWSQKKVKGCASKGTVFSFCTRSRNNSLFLTAPRNKWVTKKKIGINCGVIIYGISYLISIKRSTQLK